jgi:hypothetical protein
MPSIEHLLSKAGCAVHVQHACMGDTVLQLCPLIVALYADVLPNWADLQWRDMLCAL